MTKRKTFPELTDAQIIDTHDATDPNSFPGECEIRTAAGLVQYLLPGEACPDWWPAYAHAAVSALRLKHLPAMSDRDLADLARGAHAELDRLRAEGMVSSPAFEHASATAFCADNALATRAALAARKST